MGVDQDVASSGTMEDKGTFAEEDQQPLLKNGTANHESIISVAPSGFGYNYDNRPYRDIAFSIAFVFFVAASLGVGIFAAFHGNSDYKSLGSATYDRSQGCTLPQGFDDPANSKLNVRHLLSSDDVQSASILKLFLYIFVATVILMLPVAFGLLWVLRKYTKELVYATLPFFLIIPAASAIALFVSCNLSKECVNTYDPTLRYFSLGFVLCLNVFFLWVLIQNWDRVELTIRIIRTASEALHQNLGLMFLLPALNLSYLLYLVPGGFCLFFAYTNGKIITNPDLVQDPDLICGGTSDRPCCVWETDAWVPAYLILTIFVMLWGSVVMAEIHVFTISGTISQWYFSTTESSTVGTTKRSLLHALGPSFGTVCFSGLVVAFVRTIRSAIESSRSSRGEVGFVAIIVRACLVCLLSAVEFLTKFTTNFSAITGESFCSSATMTYDLLRRNLLSTLVVESITGRLLGQVILVIAAVYGVLVWVAVILFVQNGKHLWYLAGFAFMLLLCFLLYCMQVLHNVVDTVYICFAMDKDHNEVSKPEIHDVYVLLPTADDGTASLAVSRSSMRSMRS